MIQVILIFLARRKFAGYLREWIQRMQISPVYRLSIADFHKWTIEIGISSSKIQGLWNANV